MRSESCSFIWHPKVRIRYFWATTEDTPGGGARRSVLQDEGLVVGRAQCVDRVDRVDGVAAETPVDTDADLLADALGDLDHHLEVLGQEDLGVLASLAQLLALVGVPGARL